MHSRRSAVRWCKGSLQASLQDIVADENLSQFARAQGRPVFLENCAPCHGGGGGGAKGYPNLLDDEWLWGGRLEDIELTIRDGIRSAHSKSARAACRRSGATASSSGLISRRSRTMCARLRGLDPIRPRIWTRQKDLCRNLRRLSWRRRQGQPRDRCAESDRRDLALWLRSIVDHRGASERSRRHDAGLGRPAGREHHQGAHDLRPHPRRRSEVSHGARRRGQT